MVDITHSKNLPVGGVHPTAYNIHITGRCQLTVCDSIILLITISLVLSTVPGTKAEDVKIFFKQNNDYVVT